MGDTISLFKQRMGLNLEDEKISDGAKQAIGKYAEASEMRAERG